MFDRQHYRSTDPKEFVLGMGTNVVTSIERYRNVRSAHRANFSPEREELIFDDESHGIVKRDNRHRSLTPQSPNSSTNTSEWAVKSGIKSRKTA
jgi:hypothetical protein